MSTFLPCLFPWPHISARVFKYPTPLFHAGMSILICSFILVFTSAGDVRMGGLYYVGDRHGRDGGKEEILDLIWHIRGP